MLCESCGKHEAEFHYKSNVNGKVTEKHLCSHCAKEQGYSGVFAQPSGLFGSYTGDYMSNMISGFFGGKPTLGRSKRSCPVCGATAREIAEKGLAGCAGCYDEFADMLEPYIKRIHGVSEHHGKIPEAAGAGVKAQQQLRELKKQLQTAIEAQEFEQAAELRDKIKELEKGGEQ